MQRLIANLRFARALVVTNLRASLALRASFWLQAAFMAGNNFAFFTMWWILFARFKTLGSWRVDDMLTLFGVVAPGFGLAVALAGGARTLARGIVDGELDPLLVQPKSPLLHWAGSASAASGWGDLASGIGMLWLAGRLDWANAPFIALAIAASAVAFAASSLAFQSLAFWLGDVEQLALQLRDFTLNFALYPQPLFGGAIQLLLYTLLPAAAVGFLPVAVVRAPSVWTCAGALAGAVAWGAVAVGIFALGLRRYESGSRFGARG
ncbi:MAG TPA: ABC-2 family transporter protein [Myxococcota bacterium]|nr:ABC-2 family transporter protein [Myxococcota bacterium]